MILLLHNPLLLKAHYEILKNKGLTICHNVVFYV